MTPTTVTAHLQWGTRCVPAAAVQRHAGAVVVRASRRHARVQRASRATPLRCCASSDQQQQQQQQQQEGQQPHAQQQAPAPSAGAVPMYVTLSALASAGAAETAYLAATKLLDVAAACPTSGCDSVLNSPFGSLFGLPLPLFGAATYGGVALAAGLAAAAASRGARVPRWLGWGLAGGVGVLATTSAALMAILHTQLGGAPCLWCYASAGISAALLATLLAGMEPRQLSDAAAPGLGGTVAAALVLYLGFGSSLSGSAAELELPYASPVVTTASSEQALALARRLRESGAAMYGAFWCSHCYDQKQEFGAAAMKDFPYVECFPEGWKKGVKIAPACEAAGVKAFPTWVIGGTATEGQLELSALQEMLDKSSSTGAADSNTAAPAPAAAAAQQ